MADPTLMPDGNAKPTPVGNYLHLTATGTTLVKTGAGFLYSITFNQPVATTVLEYNDALTRTNAMGIVTVPASPQPVTLPVNVAFTTGLSVTVATAASDITLSYR